MFSGSRNTPKYASNMTRNHVFYSEIRSIEKDGNIQLIPRHNIFHVYKVFLFDIWKQFYIMLESIEFSLTRYPVFRLRRVCFLSTVSFCVVFSTFCTMFSLVNYQAVTSLLAGEVSIAE